MTEQIKPENAPNGDAATGDELDQDALKQIDNLLTEVDPEFLQQAETLKAEKIEADIDIESLDLADSVKSSGPIKRRIAVINNKLDAFTKNWKTLLIAGLKGLVPFVLGKLKIVFGFIGGVLGSALKLPLKKKLALLSAIVLLGGLGYLVKRSLKGGLLPQFELKFIKSFEEVADRKFEIEKNEPFEDFDNPLRHPEYIVLIERLVVNLKATEAYKNPMGMFEFYVESSTQEGAIEINERQKEIRDMMARVLETSSYEELATAEGKEKVKQFLRRELNTLLTQGRIRRVFFKTIILKS